MIKEITKWSSEKDKNTFLLSTNRTTRIVSKTLKHKYIITFGDILSIKVIRDDGKLMPETSFRQLIDIVCNNKFEIMSINTKKVTNK